MPTFYPGQTDYIDQLNLLAPASMITAYAAIVGSGNGQFPVGTAAAPSISFSTSNTCGWYLDATNQPALTTSGIRRLYVTPAGLLTIEAGATITGNFTTSGPTNAANISSNQTTGVLTLGGTSGTGSITLGQSTVSQTVGVASGATTSASTKTLNLGTGGLTGSITQINLGSAAGTSTTTVTGTLGVVGSLGYSTGSGGSITQVTSKSTTVALNKASGQITMNNASLVGGGQVAFILNNSTIAATDTVIVTHAGGTGNRADYSIWVYAVNAGNCYIAVKNNTAGALSDSVLINFVVIKGVTA